MPQDLDRLLGRAGLVASSKGMTPLLRAVEGRRQRPGVTPDDIARMQLIQDSLISIHDSIAVAKLDLGRLTDVAARHHKNREIAELRVRLSGEIEALRKFG